MKNLFFILNKFSKKFLLRTMYLNLFFLSISLEFIENIGLFELLIVDILVCIIIIFYWYKKKWRTGSIEFKYYFFFLFFYGLIHSICFTFSELTFLLNSKFYSIMRVILLITPLIIIYLTFFSSKKFKL